MKSIRIAIVAILLTPTAFADGYVTTSDGVRIHYVHRTPEKADLTFVFVPGWMMPAAVWSRQVDALQSKYEVIAIDMRSQGESDKAPDGHHPARKAKDIAELLEQKQLRRVVLVAASSGVTDVAAYVDQFGTDRIAALVFVHGVAGADYDSDAAINLIRWAQRFQSDRRSQTEALVRSLFVTTPPSNDELRVLIDGAMKMPTNAAIAAFLGSMASDYRPALGKIDKPAWIVVGESRWHDQYETMQRSIQGARLEKFEQAGHGLYIEAAARFNALLEDLARQLATEAR